MQLEQPKRITATAATKPDLNYICQVTYIVRMQFAARRYLLHMITGVKKVRIVCLALYLLLVLE
jgi:hypothetical protein